MSWNEIRTLAVAFSRDWADAKEEHADAKSFWDDLFRVFGVPRRRVASFESRVKKIDGSRGYIDLLWKKMLLVEHKSRGKDLEMAHKQAKDYFPGLKDSELPRYVVVCDFARFRIIDLDTGDDNEFKLEDLPDEIQRLGFIAGYEKREIREQDPVNAQAALKLGALHDELKEIGYEGHELEVYLVRLLFCLFADDTGIFVPRDIFHDYILQRTSEDGSDLGGHLQELFQTLNRPVEKRYRSLDEQLAQFPYVNGTLFAESISTVSFTAKLRGALLECCDVNWGQISPAIFGSLFQSIMKKDERRALGAHYTSEKNILKAIGPLFLDNLRAEFESIKTQQGKLEQFHGRLSELRFLDPACGCGNFLVIAYRELRLLELDVIRARHGRTGRHQLALDAMASFVKVDVDQFYGIEIEEWPAQIARVAMWLIDHQMNVMVSKEFGNAFVRVPLVKSANILQADALETDWNDVLPSARCDFVLGNPPFRGARLMSTQQKATAALALHGVPGANNLDYVAGWYVKTAHYLSPRAEAALVSTNSITQGEQVGILWSYLLGLGVDIKFAHRTFKWANEAGKVAAVHCVIIGFSRFPHTKKRLFDYASVNGEPLEKSARNISPYLVDADNILVIDRTSTLDTATPAMCFGSMANDGGALLLEEAERKEMLSRDRAAAAYIKPFFQVEQFLYNEKRYCLWLVDAPSADITRIAPIKERVGACKAHRAKSERPATRKLAAAPALFGEIRQPKGRYLLVPRHTGENRRYIPMGFMRQDQICGDANLMVPNAGLYEFGVLSSLMHNAWVAGIGGRIKSDFRYSASIVYNNFPWPENVTDVRRRAIAECAQAVLDCRAAHKGETLAELYEPLSMPADLLAAHRKLDRAVDAAYGRRSFGSDAERVAFLLEQYRDRTEALLRAPPVKKTGRRVAA
ncbi:class I SAM-dependent DNA methyltransferase [Ramlibacter albus]|nr:DNA methyltransferase [Ramlibacter albus]